MMRTTICITALLAFAITGADGQFAAQSPDRKSVTIHQRAQPVYPLTLLENGVNRGSAHLVINVDHEGFLTDWLVVGYSHREFGDAAASAVRRWNFEPMLVGGEPVPAQVELFFDFRVEGAVVSLIGSAMGPQHLIPAMAGRGGDWPRTMRQIDRVPMPVAMASPLYDNGLKDRGIAGTAVVEFYIDRNGNVRMPAVIENDYLELGALAVQAVRQWSFEPATERGRPVLVKVRQTFNFGSE